MSTLLSHTSVSKNVCATSTCCASGLSTPCSYHRLVERGAHGHHAVNDDIGCWLVNFSAILPSRLNVVCRHLLHVTSLQSRLAEREERAALHNMSQGDGLGPCRKRRHLTPARQSLLEHYHSGIAAATDWSGSPSSCTMKTLLIVEQQDSYDSSVCGNASVGTMATQPRSPLWHRSLKKRRQTSVLCLCRNCVTPAGLRRITDYHGSCLPGAMTQN